MKLPLLAAGGAVSLLVAVSGCGGGDEDVPSNAVAKVGDTVITTSAFNHRLDAMVRGKTKGTKPIVYQPPDFDACVAVKKKQEVTPQGQKGKSEDDLRKECEQEYTDLRTQAMEFLIQQQWVADEAAKVHVTVTQAEVRKDFERQKKQAFPKEEDYKTFLQTSGRTEADILLEVRTNLSQQKLAKKATAKLAKVSDAEVAAYYAKNKKQLGKPERRTLRVVIAKDEAQAQEAKDALASGDSWDVVAKKYSSDKATASKGGLLPDVTATGDKKVDAALAGAKIGTVSEPTKTQFGWWIYEVEKVIPPTVPPLKDARAQIANALKQQNQQKALDQFANSFREEYRGQTVCAADYKVASCKNGPEENPTASAPSMKQPNAQQDN